MRVEPGRAAHRVPEGDLSNKSGKPSQIARYLKFYYLLASDSGKGAVYAAFWRGCSAGTTLFALVGTGFRQNVLT